MGEIDTAAALPSRQGDGTGVFSPVASALEVIVKYSPEQSNSDGGAAGRARARANSADRVLRLHPAAGVVCPRCGSRIGRSCVATVPAFGVGSVGTPIEGVHAERIASAREAGVA